MNDIVKNKHVLGALTLGDIKDQIEGLEVEIEEAFFPKTRISGGELQLWETINRRYRDNPYRKIDLNSPIKVKDGSVFLSDSRWPGGEEEMKFSKTIEIL